MRGKEGYARKTTTTGEAGGCRFTPSTEICTENPLEIL